MRTVILSVFTLVIVMAVLPVQARGYFGVRGGISEAKEGNVINERTDAGMVSAYIGAYTGPLRGEVEYTFVTNSKYDTHDMEARFQRVMANAYIDIPVTPYVIPYISGGAGTVFRKVEYMGEKEDGNTFAWSAGLGLGIKLTRNIIADAGYRYVDMGDVTVHNADMHFDAHEGYFGIRFLF